MNAIEIRLGEIERRDGDYVAGCQECSDDIRFLLKRIAKLESEPNENLARLVERVKKYAIARDALRAARDSLAEHDHNLERVHKCKRGVGSALADLYRILVIVDGVK